MGFFRNRFVMHDPKKLKAHYNLNEFKQNLTTAASKGQIDTATAIEHMHTVSTLAAKEKHFEAARYITELNKKLGLNPTGHYFGNEHSFK